MCIQLKKKKLHIFLGLLREMIGMDILGICSFKDKGSSLHAAWEQDAMRISSKAVLIR